MSVRIALCDSGVNAAHPHVAGAGELVAGPVRMPDGSFRTDVEQSDRLGHGTAAAAAILDLCPGATLYSIQLFRERAACELSDLVGALEAALEWEPQIVNLSLGTTRSERPEELARLVARAREANVILVAPAAYGGLPSYPGTLAGVEGVLMNADLERTAPRRSTLDDHPVWYASPFPRELPGLPRGNNLAGVSMACANLTGFLASRLRGDDQTQAS